MSLHKPHPRAYTQGMLWGILCIPWALCLLCGAALRWIANRMESTFDRWGNREVHTCDICRARATEYRPAVVDSMSGKELLSARFYCRACVKAGLAASTTLSDPRMWTPRQ